MYTDDNISGELLQKAQILYEFVDLFSNYENTARNYTGETNDCFSMTEVHLLAAIYNNEGVTLTELAMSERRSKSFVSQIINKLEKNGYLVKTSEKGDTKKKSLYTSEKGKQLCVAHNNFDELTLAKTYHYLLRDCTPQEITSFYKVMQVYNVIMKKADQKRNNRMVT